MTADRHRRDAYASAGARVSQHGPRARGTTTGSLGVSGTGRTRRSRRRSRSQLPTLLVAIGLILGFVLIIVLLMERGQQRLDPFATIEAQLRAEAPGTFSAPQLDSIGQRLVAERLAQGHAGWFAAARQEHGEQQRAVMGEYWDLAARDLAADQAVQDAYRRADLSFAFRGKWFGMRVEPAAPAATAAPTAQPPSKPVPAVRPQPPSAPAQPPPAEPAPAPAGPPAEPSAIERLM